MGSRWKVTLITFILFLTSAGFSQDLDGLLSHCPSDVIVSEGIVDIKTSLARGASLLQGRETEGYEACVEECCVDGQCDLALYRLVGLSDSGNNCYFIQCGDPANCKIVKHNEFVFAFTTGEKTEGGDAPGRENVPRVKPVDDAESTAPPSVHHHHSSLLTEQQPIPTKDLATESTLAPDTRGTDDTPTPRTESKEVPDSTDAPPSPDVQSSDAQDQELSTVTIEEADDCKKNGCNGAGVVVFGVLGGIAVLLLTLIALALGKRLYDFYKRKQFSNVDYLINGMYA